MVAMVAMVAMEQAARETVAMASAMDAVAKAG